MAWEDEDKVNNDTGVLRDTFTDRLYEVKPEEEEFYNQDLMTLGDAFVNNPMKLEEADAEHNFYRKRSISEFEKKLVDLINRHSMEWESNTPDYILAEYLMNCLRVWNLSVQRREQWYGRGPQYGEPPEEKKD